MSGNENKNHSARLYIRSDEELAMQNKGLVELSDILTSLNIVHYLTSGTLLGAVREKDFIKWDWDVQLYFRTEDVIDRFYEIIEALEKNNFVPEKIDGTYNKFKICVVKYNTSYEMTAWHLKGNKRLRSEWSLPAHFFELGSTINFRGRIYQCMNPPIEYLVHAYGSDWHIPKRTDDKSEYLASSFYRQPSWMRSIKKALKGLYCFTRNTAKTCIKK